MGTNYYFRYNICSCCDRYDQLHIGKSSAGWQFTFHQVDEYIDSRALDPKAALLGDQETRISISSYAHWKKMIQTYVVDYQTAKIYNEYGDEIEPEALYDIIDKKKSGRSHGNEVRDGLLDPEGNSFITGEFS